MRTAEKLGLLSNLVTVLLFLTGIVIFISPSLSYTVREWVSRSHYVPLAEGCFSAENRKAFSFVSRGTFEIGKINNFPEIRKFEGHRLPFSNKTPVRSGEDLEGKRDFTAYAGDDFYVRQILPAECTDSAGIKLLAKGVFHPR